MNYTLPIQLGVKVQDSQFKKFKSSRFLDEPSGRAERKNKRRTFGAARAMRACYQMAES